MDKVKIENYFKDLVFDELNHVYYVKGVALNKSVSKICSDYAPKFNADAISTAISKRDNISKEELLASWNQAKNISIDKGNVSHSFGERYYENRNTAPETKIQEQIINFWNTIPPHIIPVSSELRMYHKKFLFAGTCDLLLYNTKTGTYILVDYKTNKDLFKNYNEQKLLGVFDNMLDCPYSKYVIQLNLYKILLEQVKDVIVSDMKIVWLKENEFITFDCLNYKQELLLDLTDKHNENKRSYTKSAVLI